MCDDLTSACIRLVTLRIALRWVVSLNRIKEYALNTFNFFNLLAACGVAAVVRRGVGGYSSCDTRQGIHHCRLFEHLRYYCRDLSDQHPSCSAWSRLSSGAYRKHGFIIRRRNTCTNYMHISIHHKKINYRRIWRATWETNGGFGTHDYKCKMFGPGCIKGGGLLAL